MADIFGERVTQMKYYDMIHTEVDGWKFVISAPGFSTELGYKIYLEILPRMPKKCGTDARCWPEAQPQGDRARSPPPHRGWPPKRMQGW